MSDNSLQDAQTLLDKGDHLGARAIVAQQLAATPDDVAALHLMSTIDMIEGLNEQAVKLINRVLAIEPEHAPAIYNLGVCQMNAGQDETAFATFNRALDVNPNHSGALYNVGALLRKKGDVAKALRFFERLVKANPNWVSAWEAYCETLLAAHRYADVVSSVDVLTRQSKTSAMLYRMRGMANLGLADAAQAETDLIMSFRANDRDPDTMLQLAGLFRVTGRLKEAIPLYERVLVIAAQNPSIIDRFDPGLSELILTCRSASEWARLKVYEEQAIKRLVNENGAIHPQVAVQLTDDKVAALTAARHAWPRDNFISKLETRTPAERAKDRPLRIGFLSSTFGNNFGSHVITALATAADKNRFSYHGFNTGVVGSANSELKRASQTFRNVRNSSDEDIARMIVGDEVDVLINLEGFEAHSRAGVLAYKPAPVVASYASFPGTMGTKLIDYLIADEVLVPTGEEDGYDEAIVRLPGGSRAIRPNPSVQISSRIRMNYGLKSDVPVFAVFSEASAIGPDLLSLYATILKDAPASQLWLAADDLQVRSNIRNHLVARGVAADRVVFADRTSPEEHAERIKLADLALDTFPLSRPTAVGNALLAGVPVLTLKGRNFASRLGASLVTAAGMPELAVSDAKAFHDTALRLTSNPKELEGLKAKLAASRATAPVFDLQHLRRHLERAFEMMAERHAKGLAPASFSVPSLS